MAPRSREADRALALPRGLLVLLSVAGVVVAVAGLRSASGIVGPAFLALILVITIHPLLAWLQRHRVPGWLAVALTMLVAYASLVALAAASHTHSVLGGAAGDAASQLPAAVHQPCRPVHQVARRAWGHPGADQRRSQPARPEQPGRRAPTGGDWDHRRRLGPGVHPGVTVLPDLDSSSFPRRLAAAAAQRPDLVEALTGFAGVTRQYVVVSTVFGLIVALVDVAALYWLDVPLPWLWGLLSFITNYIPNIGFVLGLLPPALLALLQGGVRQAVLVIVAYSVINVMIQSLLQPKFVGDAVGLSITLTFLSLVF